MSITTTQKIIKIGTSKGITVPTKELRRLGAEVGDEIKITAELVKPARTNRDDVIMQEYKQFVDQYGETLKNLADR